MEGCSPMDFTLPVSASHRIQMKKALKLLSVKNFKALIFRDRKITMKFAKFYYLLAIFKRFLNMIN
jgi:hypothetical protein